MQFPMNFAEVLNANADVPALSRTGIKLSVNFGERRIQTNFTEHADGCQTFGDVRARRQYLQILPKFNFVLSSVQTRSLPNYRSFSRAMSLRNCPQLPTSQCA
jgi:hypothetical protein